MLCNDAFGKDYTALLDFCGKINHKTAKITIPLMVTTMLTSTLVGFHPNLAWIRPSSARSTEQFHIAPSGDPSFPGGSGEIPPFFWGKRRKNEDFSMKNAGFKGIRWCFDVVDLLNLVRVCHGKWQWKWQTVYSSTFMGNFPRQTVKLPDGRGKITWWSMRWNGTLNLETKFMWIKTGPKMFGSIQYH